MDRSGAIEQVNLTLARVLQVDRARIVGQPLSHLVELPGEALAEAIETCEVFGEADLPRVTVSTGDTFAVRASTAFSDPEGRVILTFTPVATLEAPPFLAKLVRDHYGHARPLQSRLRAALSDPTPGAPDLRARLQAALDPRPDDPFDPVRVLHEAREWAGCSAEVVVQSTVPRACIGDATLLRAAIGALLSEVAPVPPGSTLSARYSLSDQQLVMSLTPFRETRPPACLAVLATGSGVHAHADGLALTVSVRVQAAPATLGSSGEAARLLLVEDDPVSALLVRVQLEQLGAVVEHASTGAEAIQMLRTRHYPVVVLDCLLPDMDGRAVFDFMKELPADRAPGRIIATSGMVGGVLPGGMAHAPVDAILPKPVQLSSVRAALGPWPPSTTIRPIPAGADAPVLETATITSLHTIVGGQATVNEVLSEFIEDLTRSHPVLARALGDGDMDTVRRTAHRLKGAAATVGARRVERAARALEQAASEEDIGGSAREISQLIAEARAVHHAIADLFV
jgi:CheY-like chemotaxis protein/HPt (histidine-containing phosphotransfer) domain-containing protein